MAAALKELTMANKLVKEAIKELAEYNNASKINLEEARNALARDAYLMARGIAEGLLRDIDGAHIKDPEDFGDALHQAVDSALIYTSDQWQCAWLLRDSDDFDDLNDPKAPLEQQLACKAYCNLRQEVLSFSCFDNIGALFEESENES